MALPNVPKTDWTVSDGVVFTDMNEIGENIQDLEDDKYESGDDINVGDATIGGSITPRTPATEPAGGFRNLAAGASWIIERGIYMIFSATSDHTLEIFTDSVWRGSAATTFPYCVIADGVNVRLRNTSGSVNRVVYYRKF